jgi:hypothetical protein
MNSSMIFGGFPAAWTRVGEVINVGITRLRLWLRLDDDTEFGQGGKQLRVAGIVD